MLAQNANFSKKKKKKKYIYIYIIIKINKNMIFPTSHVIISIPFYVLVFNYYELLYTRSTNSRHGFSSTLDSTRHARRSIFLDFYIKNIHSPQDLRRHEY